MWGVGYPYVELKPDKAYHCESCNVYGKGDECWMCASANVTLNRWAFSVTGHHHDPTVVVVPMPGGTVPVESSDLAPW